jgi:hypothetical protein
MLGVRRAEHAKRGQDLDQLIVERGWDALPIWGRALPEFWVARERTQAQLPPGADFDARLPSFQAAQQLVRRFRLGDDYLETMWSLLLGVPPGGGEADVTTEPRPDGSGIRVVLTCIRYDCTAADWRRLFSEVIQPTLLFNQGKIPQGVTFAEGIKGARRKARPGRPPYQPEVLDLHFKMWKFCRQHSYLGKHLGEHVYDAFVESLPEDESLPLLDMDHETFRRAVPKLDRLMHPATGSETDLSS